MLTRCDADGTARAVVPNLEPGRRYGGASTTGTITPPPLTKTPWLDISPNAVLHATLGFLGAGPPVTEPVVFGVFAENLTGGRAEIGTWEIPPETTGQGGAWQPVQASLAHARRVLGPRMRLAFEATSVDTAASMIVPLWGDPTVLRAVPERKLPRPPNVVLVSLDTLRADRLGAYGYPLPITPHLDRFAAQGTMMARTTALANWTVPSHATLLTGMFPCGHGFRGRMGQTRVRPFPRAVRPLAELLRREGYRTAAFTEDAFVDRLPFQRGFGRFEFDRALEGSETAGLAEKTFGAALSWLAEHGEAPFFLFLHTYQVHAPYTPPAAGRARVPTPLPLPPGGLPPKEEAAADAAAYVAEVAHLDRAVGTFLAGLGRLGLAEGSIVVITSDHGESFGEHRVLRHGMGLYEEELRVPLLWRGPGRIAAGRRVEEFVTLADVTPTLLALLGRPVPPEMQGVSLVPLLDPNRAGARLGPRIVPIEGMTMSGLRGSDWKLLPGTGAAGQLVVLAHDPGEMRPVDVGPDHVQRMQRAVEHECARAAKLLAEDAPGEPAERSVEPDPDQARKLRALGYAE